MNSRVAIVQRVLPHYRVMLFEDLRERLGSVGIELVVIHGQPQSSEQSKRDSGELSWAVTVQNRYVRFGRRSLCWQPVLRQLRGCDLVVVEQASRLLVNYPLLVWRLLRGPRVAYWGHGKNLDAREPSRIGEWAKHRLVRRADWWFAYTQKSADLLAQAGVDAGTVTVLQNAIDTNALAVEHAALTKADLAKARAELGIGEERVIVMLGSLYPSKRVTFAITVVDLLQKLVPGVQLIVIGDGPDGPQLDMAAVSRPWVHVLGARVGGDLVRYAALGDVMLNPGLVGLSIVDSFALRVPMVTCELDYHSPEVSYLVDGENGCMLSAGSTPEQFATAIGELLASPSKLSRLRDGCGRSAKQYTVEEMSRRFADGITSAIGARPDLEKS